jgi:hypothetical protein
LVTFCLVLFSTGPEPVSIVVQTVRSSTILFLPSLLGHCSSQWIHIQILSRS